MQAAQKVPETKNVSFIIVSFFGARGNERNYTKNVEYLYISHNRHQMMPSTHKKENGNKIEKKKVFEVSQKISLPKKR